jgi:hypothetical protein
LSGVEADFCRFAVTASGIRDLWTLKNPIPARTIVELIQLVESHRLAVTQIPPATRADLEELLHSSPAR